MKDQSLLRKEYSNPSNGVTKVLIVNDGFPPRAWGGANTVAYLHAQALSARGYEVRVFTGESVPRYHPRWWAYRSLFNPPVLREFKKELAAFQPHIVHFHNIHYHVSYHAILLARRAGVKVFLTTHDVMSFAYQKLHNFIDYSSTAVPTRFDYRVPMIVNLRDARKRYNPLRNVVIRFYLRKVHQIFAVSEALKQALVDNGIRDNVSVVHNGLDVDAYSPPTEPPVPTVLFVGRFTPDKGRDVTLKAFAKVVTKVPEAQLLVVGFPQGQQEPVMERLINELKLREHIIFVPPVAYLEMPTWYAKASVVVVPSIIFDSFPTANLEAMAAGKPVVATCFGGSREAVVDGETGYIVNPLDVEGMADKITELLTDKVRARKMGEAGKRRAQEKFSLERHISAYEQLYKVF